MLKKQDMRNLLLIAVMAVSTIASAQLSFQARDLRWDAPEVYRQIKIHAYNKYNGNEIMMAMEINRQVDALNRVIDGYDQDLWTNEQIQESMRKNSTPNIRCNYTYDWVYVELDLEWVNKSQKREK